MWQKDHPDTHHVVSFVENHNCPLQVNAVCPAALQQEGKGAGLEAGQTGEAPAHTTATRLYPPTTELDVRWSSWRHSHSTSERGPDPTPSMPHSHGMEEAQSGARPSVYLGRGRGDLGGVNTSTSLRQLHFCSIFIK